MYFIDIPRTHNYVVSITGLKPTTDYYIMFNDFMLRFTTTSQGELFFNKNRDPLPRNCAPYDEVRLYPIKDDPNFTENVKATINFLDKNLDYKTCKPFTVDLAFGETYAIEFEDGSFINRKYAPTHTIKNPYLPLSYAYGRRAL